MGRLPSCRLTADIRMAFMATLIKHQLGLQAIADNSVEPVMFVKPITRLRERQVMNMSLLMNLWLM